MALQELWTEKYRPNTLDGYVFSNEQQKEQLEDWVKRNPYPMFFLPVVRVLVRVRRLKYY